MNEELATILALRRVMEASTEGEGIARALVEELGGSRPRGSDVARMLLLGYPFRSALEQFIERAPEEVAMLASLLVAAPSSSAEMVGRNGSAFGAILERWVKARENARIEQKVHQFRSVVTSGVLGAVTAMISSLGPLVGTLSFAAGAPAAAPGDLLWAAAALAGLASAMLGLFMSGRRFFVNVFVTLAVFCFVAVLAAPLADVSSVTLWGVK